MHQPDRKTQFINYCTKISGHSSIPGIAGECYDELNRKYRAPGRHYHTLEHIHSVLVWFNFFENKLQDPAAVFLAAWYHDSVFDVKSKVNEEQSAAFAEQEMKKMKMNETYIEKVKKYILATKTHTAENESDLCYFLDMDLHILGSDQFTYVNYSRCIREEYGEIPAEEFCNGRMKMLDHFLSLPQIFKTEDFKLRFEAQAKFNLQWEKDMMNNR